MPDETYNGWTNWDTWNTALWLDNDEQTYRTARRIVEHHGTNPHAAAALYDLARETPGIRADGVDFDAVNWDEISAHYAEED